ncbi:MAG: phosphoribosylglycinamide formyltransferase [Clostridia bacterium]|nr:phosphoribosylglycinamide formyltransferase [Clostridia bacterium]
MLKEKVRIAVLVSGGGTGLQALINAQRDGIIKSGVIALVVSNTKHAYALTRAENAGIPTLVLSKVKHPTQEAFEAALFEALSHADIDLIVLAGFLRVLSGDFTKKYDKRIINIHPSLIPSFCGDGYYGIHVHEEALRYGVKITGATVHYVNEITDGGEIIAQKAVPVLPNDTPETLQLRVMEQAEWLLLPEAAEMVSKRLLDENNA